MSHLKRKMKNKYPVLNIAVKPNWIALEDYLQFNFLLEYLQHKALGMVLKECEHGANICSRIKREK